MDKDKIIASVLDKLRQNKLYQNLLNLLRKEEDPTEVEKIFRDFMNINKIEDKQEKQNVFAFLKLEGLFKEHVKKKGLHNVWITLRNEYAPHFLIEN